MTFNTVIDWNTCSAEQQRDLLMRPAISASESITRTVAEILDNVKARGDDALREYSAKFDKTEVGALKVTFDGKPVLDQPLVVLKDAPQGGFFKRLWDAILLLFHHGNGTTTTPAPTLLITSAIVKTIWIKLRSKSGHQIVRA